MRELTVEVVDQKGAPLPDAPVIAGWSEPRWYQGAPIPPVWKRWHATTDASGRATLRHVGLSDLHLMPGDDVRGFSDFSPFSVRCGDAWRVFDIDHIPRAVRMEVGPCSALAVDVFHHDGKPADEPLLVTAWGQESWCAQQITGKAAFRHLAASDTMLSVKVETRSVRYAVAEALRVRLEPAESRQVSITLREPLSTLSMRLTDPSGRPLGGCNIEPTFLGPRGRVDVEHGRFGRVMRTTRPDGTFEIGLPTFRTRPTALFIGADLNPFGHMTTLGTRLPLPDHWRTVATWARSPCPPRPPSCRVARSTFPATLCRAQT